jgi:HD-GYP domain-containing protein (c-di-GMP phosphodiesterase class II)
MPVNRWEWWQFIATLLKPNWLKANCAKSNALPKPPSIHFRRTCVYLLAEDGTILTVNKAWREFAEANPPTPPDYCVGANYLTVCDQAQGPNSAEAATMAAGIRAMLQGHIEHFSLEYPCDAPWEIRWFITRVTHFIENNHLRLVITHENITGRKQAEESVKLLNTQLEQQLKRLTALREIDLVITASLDLKTTLQLFLQHVLEQLQVEAAAVLLFQPATQSLRYVAGLGFRGTNIRTTNLKIGAGLAGQVALERQPLLVSDLKNSQTSLAQAGLFVSENFQAYCGYPLIAKGQLKGVLEVFRRSPLNVKEDWLDFLEALGRQAAIAIDNAQLFDHLQRSNSELTLAYDATIEGWSRALDLRDKETEGHSQRVTELTVRLAQIMSVSDAALVHVRRGALLHDIGKLGIPDNILLKPGPLTDAEWEIMRKHPQYAYDLLIPITYLRQALEIPYSHHEKWDGSGYPQGLKGTQIPLAARIFAVADVSDALHADRPYRAGWSEEEVRAHIATEAGKHFDPAVVAAFMTI